MVTECIVITPTEVLTKWSTHDFFPNEWLVSKPKSSVTHSLTAFPQLTAHISKPSRLYPVVPLFPQANQPVFWILKWICARVHESSTQASALVRYSFEFRSCLVAIVLGKPSSNLASAQIDCTRVQIHVDHTQIQQGSVLRPLIAHHKTTSSHKILQPKPPKLWQPNVWVPSPVGAFALCGRVYHATADSTQR